MSTVSTRSTVEVMQALGARIREARERAGLTQAEFARRCGTERGTAWRWETGRAEPSLAMLRTIAAVTGSDLGRLAGGAAAA